MRHRNIRDDESTDDGDTSSSFIEVVCDDDRPAKPIEGLVLDLTGRIALLVIGPRRPKVKPNSRRYRHSKYHELGWVEDTGRVAQSLMFLDIQTGRCISCIFVCYTSYIYNKRYVSNSLYTHLYVLLYQDTACDSRRASNASVRACSGEIECSSHNQFW